MTRFVPPAPQSQDFKVRCPSIQRIFILPKHNTPYTLVVISLDPPIRKGQVMTMALGGACCLSIEAHLCILTHNMC